MQHVALASSALGLAGLLSLGVLIVRRVLLARRERARLAVEERLLPVALELISDGSAPLPKLAADDGPIFASLLTRYARQLSGEAHDRISRFFSEGGFVAEELARATSRRAWRRAAAAYALGDMGAQAAVPTLVEALADPERDVRSAAARALGKLRSEAAVAGLVWVAAEDLVPRTVAAQALLAIGPPALPKLRALLSSADPPARAFAAELLGLLGEPEDGALLESSLLDASDAVRANAARALGRLAAGRAAFTLRKALEDPSSAVRAAAADALGTIGDRGAVPALLAHGRSDAFDVARAAASAAARIDPATLARVAHLPGAGPHLAEAAELRALEAA
jgi:hypothetical protein